MGGGRSIDRGLLNCRYGIVIFAKAFLAGKKWTEYELNALFARETDRVKRILPIWHGIDHSDLLKYSPAFADRLAKISATDSYTDIVQALLNILGRQGSSGSQKAASGNTAPSERISDLGLAEELYLLCCQSAEPEPAIQRRLESCGIPAAAVAELALTGRIRLALIDGRCSLELNDRTMSGNPALDLAMASLIVSLRKRPRIDVNDGITSSTIGDLDKCVEFELQRRGIVGHPVKTGMLIWSKKTVPMLAPAEREKLRNAISGQVQDGSISARVAVILKLAFACGYGKDIPQRDNPRIQDNWSPRDGRRTSGGRGRRLRHTADHRDAGLQQRYG